MQTRQAPDTFGRKQLWRVVSATTGMLGALVAKKVIRTAYQSVRRDTDPATPFDPTSTRFSFIDALVWACAAGVGLAIAKVVSARLAAIGWEAVTGTLPPGTVEEPAIV